MMRVSSRRPSCRLTIHAALWALVAAVGQAACGGGGVEPPELTLWPNPEQTLPQAQYFDGREWLLDVSSWSAEGCGPEQPFEARYMGDFGTGNGHAFALTGYACPLNTLHNMAGPDYQQEAMFFRDTWLEVVPGPGAEPIEVVDGRIYRVRRSSIVMAWERAEALELITVTFAPLGDGPGDPINRAVVRVAVVRNASGQSVDGVELHSQQADQTKSGRPAWSRPTRAWTT